MAINLFLRMFLFSSHTLFTIYFLIFLGESLPLADNLSYESTCSLSDNVVDCSGKQLTKTPDIPPSTKILKLNKNSLSEMPNFKQNINLVEMNLGHNNISFISRTCLEKIENLVVLEISNNEIQKIRTNDFPSMKKLTNLTLNHNQISEIENGSFSGLSNLIDLKLNRNKLTQWHDHMLRELRMLQVLELNRNQFTFIGWFWFKGLNKLSILKLRHNMIDELQDGAFHELCSLIELHLDHNRLSAVAKGWLYQLQQLKLLNVSNNQITSLSDGWESCPYLEILDLSNNLLDSIMRTTFEHLSVLTTLKLHNNQISFIEDGAFEFLPSLQTLDLSYNHISWIVEYNIGAFSSLNKLNVLLLNGNNIFKIPRTAFAGLDNITSIDLQSNPISGIQENPFENLTRLKELFLNSSSLICDCSLKWLNLWLNSTSVKVRPGNLSCIYPTTLKTKPLNIIRQKEFVCAANDHPLPQITVHPEDVISYVGNNVTLRCGANSSLESDMTFIWKVDNHILNAQTKRYESAQNRGVTQFSDLLLNKVSLKQNGNYQCVVSNDFGIAYSKPSQLTVLEFPTFIKTPSNVVAKVGSHAKLECSVAGIPTPTISWQKDNGGGIPAALERRMQVMNQDEPFYIINVKLVDAGTYTCKANNSAGTITANATLTVLEPPTLNRVMKNKEVKFGDSVVLECLAGGSPKPKISWMKDGQPLVMSKRHYLAANDQLLFITDAMATDIGEYDCEMSNTLGSIHGKSKLMVVTDYFNAAKEEGYSGWKEDKGIFSGVDLILLLAIIFASAVMGILFTSIFWVLVIYYNSKKSSNENMPLSPIDNKSEDSSQSSKDSGTGDSTRRSYQDLLLVTSTMNHSSIIHGSRSESPSPVPEATLPLLTTFHPVQVDGSPYSKDGTFSRNKQNANLTPIHYQNKPADLSGVFCASPASSNGVQCACLTATLKKKDMCECFPGSSPVKHNCVVNHCNGVSAEHEICYGDISKRPCSIPVPFHTSHTVSTNCCRHQPNSYLCLYMPQHGLPQ